MKRRGMCVLLALLAALCGVSCGSAPETIQKALEEADGALESIGGALEEAGGVGGIMEVAKQGVQELLGGDTALAPGAVDGDVYENVTLGYGCKLEGWTLSVPERNDETPEEIGGVLGDLLKSVELVTDLTAESADGKASVQVAFQNLSALGKLVDADSLLNAALPMLTSPLESVGYEGITSESTAVELAGETVPGIAVAGRLEDEAVYMKEVCLMRDRYAVLIAVQTAGEDTTDEIFSAFYKL